MTRTREEMLARSNNPSDPNRNLCSLAVAKHLGVERATAYLHTRADLIAAVRSRFDIHVRSGLLKKGMCVEQMRVTCLKRINALFYLAFLRATEDTSHVILLDADGRPLQDTNPQQQGLDLRSVIALYGVWTRNRSEA